MTKKKIKPTEADKKKIAAKMKAATAAGKPCSKIARDAAAHYGYSAQQVYRWARDHGWVSGKALRRDSGLSEAELEIANGVNKIYSATLRINAKESRMPTARAIMQYEQTTGKKVPWAEHTLRAHWRRMEISRKHARLPEPTRPMISDHANHVHAIDFSVSNFYLSPDKQIVPMWKRDFNKNKPDKWLKKRQLRLMMMVDHNSHAMFPMYYTAQKAVNIADFCFCAWANKNDPDYINFDQDSFYHDPEFIFHGLPKILLTDNDKALHSYSMQRMFNSLEIHVPKGESYKAWTKGSVEKAIDIWQRWFETIFMVDKYRLNATIKDINRWAFAFAKWFNSTRIHTRHQQTRFKQWNDRIEDHLIELPDYETYKKLLYSEPEQRTIDTNRKFLFNNNDYELRGLPPKSKIDVFVFPFQSEDGTITVQYPSRTENLNNYQRTDIQTFTIKPFKKNADGFPKVGIRFGTYEERKETKTQKNLKKVEETKLPEAMQPGQHPFEIPLPANTPKFIPRTGKRIQAKSDIEYKPIEFNLFQFQKMIVEKLGRPLGALEHNRITSLGKQDKFTEEDLKTVLDYMESMGYPSEAGGNNA